MSQPISYNQEPSDHPGNHEHDMGPTQLDSIQHITRYILEGQIDGQPDPAIIKAEILQERVKLTTKESQLVFDAMRAAKDDISYRSNLIAGERMSLVSRIFNDILVFQYNPRQNKNYPNEQPQKRVSLHADRDKVRVSYDPLPYEMLKDARCRQLKMQNVFLKTGASKAEKKLAKSVCRSCIVVRNCLELGVGINSKEVIYGGHEDFEIRKIRKSFISLNPGIRNPAKVLPLDPSHPDRKMLDSVIDEALEALFSK